ncbi:MAG: ABC transporter ATP-binding protein [Candidatus Magnetoovum sp. WYHC-5]|nr:ABC transporter ATP-binding protein [Candidatus Magnetoovum sp. WYHC-5]
MVKKDISYLKQKNLLHMENIYKIYDGKVVLNDIDLSVSKGELCTVVGPSGCGKSTLLRLILGQERPDKGEIFIEGKPVGFASKDRGIVYQKYSLFPHLSVIENVIIGKKFTAGLFAKKQVFIEEGMEYLKRVRLDAHYNKYPHELSGGMQQRVAIAQSLIMKPKILLMDEPFGALDPGTREDIQVFLLELWEDIKMNIFFVTHDLEEAVFLGTRIIVLSQFYTDGLPNDQNTPKGAKIVADHALERIAASTTVKKSIKNRELIEQIKLDGFSPEYLQRISEFNLRHPDSFQTI